MRRPLVRSGWNREAPAVWFSKPAPFLLVALVVFASHLPFLTLPFFWDELGQFVPQSLDLYRQAAWFPTSTSPNVHPPGVEAYLALVWSLFGYSIAATRAAMLLLASLWVYVSWRLARELCGPAAWFATALLLVSPIVYTQSMMVQLDMPAALWTTVALWLFLRERWTAAALACVGLVLTKETGVAVPVVLGAWLWWEGRRREALLFAVAPAALAAWLAALQLSTGHLFGDREFTRYNVFFPLHPLRLTIAILRRVYYLFVENFHWVGGLAILWALWRTPLFRSRRWALVTLASLAQALLVTVLGGATLERYLLPVLPVVYAAMALALAQMAALPRRIGQGVLLAGLVAALFWNPWYRFPFENNLAMTDFVRLHQSAAAWLEQNAPGRTVVTYWPLLDAVRQPDFGYVSQPFAVKSLEQAVPADPHDILVLFSRDWVPPRRLFGRSLLGGVWKRYYNYEAPLTPEEAATRFKLKRAARWERRGQWIEILTR